MFIYVKFVLLYVQGWKQEKNLKFLLQKVLKQSDVGNLGRIVLPKVLLISRNFPLIAILSIMKKLFLIWYCVRSYGSKFYLLQFWLEFNWIIYTERSRNPSSGTGNKGRDFDCNGRYRNFSRVEHALQVFIL